MDLEQFYMKNYRIVFGYLYSLCGNRALAEDLTSETFLVAIKKADSYDWTQKPASLLCTIGRNLLLKEQSRSKRYVPLDSVELADNASLEEHYIESQLAVQIHRLAAGLDESKQRVFAMRLTGLSFREIGDALGRTENWARVTYFRAKNEILKRLEVE